MNFKSFCVLVATLLGGLFFKACQKPKPPVYDVPANFEKYIKRFKEEATNRGQDVDLKQSGLIVAFQETGNLEPSICHLGQDGSAPQIGIDETYWNAADDINKELTIFHELGHCILNREHKNDTLKNGHWASILRGSPEVPASRPLHYNIYRDYYLDELFSPQTAIAPQKTSKIEFVYPKNSPLMIYDIVLLGQSQSQDIVVSNSGDGTLSISSLDLCSNFSSNFSSTVLPPNSQKTLTFTFAPTTKGFHRCTASVNSNDPDNPQTSPILIGIGVENTPNWRKITDFKDAPYSNEFSIGNKGYLIGINNEFWEYTPNTSQWSQKNNFPGNPSIGGTAFVLNGKGYLAFGNDSNDLWEYDPITDTWSQKTNFPGVGRSHAVSFVLHNKAYIASGANSNFPFPLTDFWEYDPTTDTWTSKQTLPNPVDQGIGFAIGNKGYVGLGRQSAAIYEYDVASDQWFLKTQYPSATTIDATAFVINNVAYIGTGNSTNGTYSSKLWKYSNNTWQPIHDAPIKKAAAAAFVINNKAYWGGGYINGYGLALDFWEFTP